MNTVAVPRRPNELMGALAKLTPLKVCSCRCSHGLLCCIVSALPFAAALQRQRANHGRHCVQPKEKLSGVFNVEYSVLDQALKGETDDPDPSKGGFSKYPGNTNILVFDAQIYTTTLLQYACRVVFGFWVVCLGCLGVLVFV